LDISLEEIQTLSILDAIEGNHRASQRELSKTTGLNLAKVNFLLRRLAEKGQVKLRNISKSPNKRRYLYILTPKGLAEKSRLTLRFAARTLREYSRTIAIIQESLSRLAGTGVRRIVLIGVNEVTALVVDAARQVPSLSVVGVICPEQDGGKCRGVPVFGTADPLEFDRAVPCEHVDVHNGRLAAEVGIPTEKIWLM
jgi:EPS-associated MarR family transcriptional regulator